MLAGDERGWIRRAADAYRLRLKRRRYLARAIRKRRQLQADNLRTDKITSCDILCFSTVRNEIERIEHFIRYHRGLGVSHFLIVDNGSTDGTLDVLRSQPDVSLWTTNESYKSARYGVDWLTWLQFKYGHGHWCLTLDADELFLPPYSGAGVLGRLTRWLDQSGKETMGALMLDLYPNGPLGAQPFEPGQDPLPILGWFDRGGLRTDRREDLKVDLVRGGVRGRVFFQSQPDRAPTLSKAPLVKWNRRYAYHTSTHVILPPRLNAQASLADKGHPTAALLHTKFLPSIIEKSQQERVRKEHFANSNLYEGYYDALETGPNLWSEESVRFEGWEQLERLGLISRGSMPDPYES